MSESIQVTPSASAAVHQSKLSSLESGTNPASTEDSEGFTAVFAGYIESETGVTEQQVEENLTELLNELLPQNMLEDGNALPQDENVAMWQALMILQPTENAITNSVTRSMQGMDLLDSKEPMFNSRLLSQDYFQTVGLQHKEMLNAAPNGLATNNITAQLAATHFIPEVNDAKLLNINEQLMPVQGTNSILSQSLAAVGLGSVTQAAATQTQMVPLNLGQNAWETHLGSRLQMLVGQNVQSAEIRLDPPELGALEIKIKVTNEVASVNITSPHSQVREALETAVPRLREMFEESGLSLADVNVRQESFAEQQNLAEEESSTTEQVAESESVDDPIVLSRKISSDNLLDTYA